MKYNKIIAGLLTLCLIGGTLTYNFHDFTDFYASAAEETEYPWVKFGTYGKLNEMNYIMHGTTNTFEVGYVEISGYAENVIPSHIEVPASINGLPVTEIGDYVFNGQTLLQEVILPDTITTIGRGAFGGCSRLKDIKLPDSLISIDTMAFAYCESLYDITIPKNVAGFSTYDFCDCTSLEKITVKNSDCEISLLNDDDIPNLKEIVGYDGSTAQTFAEEYGLTFVSLNAINQTPYQRGDVNGDGTVNAVDASVILAEYAWASTGHETSFSLKQIKAANIILDGKIDSSDASLILSYYAYTSTGGDKTLSEFLSK